MVRGGNQELSILGGRLLHHPFRGLDSVHIRYGLHTRQVGQREAITLAISKVLENA